MARGCSKKHFEENQISPGLIRLLLLPTAHARTFQRSRLRSSAPFYGHFNLSMGRSPGFGSISSDIFAHFRLAFATAPHRKCLTTPLKITRRSIMQKVRRQTFSRASPGLSPPTACKFMVSGSFNSPSRRSVDLSVTLLVHYRSTSST